MNNSPNRNFMESLVELSKVDSALARNMAEKKKFENELSALRTKITVCEKELQQKSKIHQDKKTLYVREEKMIKEEGEKLVSRRKALSTLGNYKLQQAAEREIEHAAHQVSAREEGLIALLDELEKLNQNAKGAEDNLNAIKTDLEKKTKEAQEAFTVLEEQGAKHLARREELAKAVEAAILNGYQRIKERFPTDAVVPITNGTCPGCFMQVAPQLTVQILKGDALVKCRGCGRILYCEAPSVTTGTQQG